jgi:hypothetical protein
VHETLIERVAAALQERGVAHAVIGATALAAHGYARSTRDIDLLAVDAAVLSIDWASVLPPSVEVEACRGDGDDPLAGVVRFTSGSESVDLVIGRWKWQAEAIARAEQSDLGFAVLPVITLTDLVLLKIDAGGGGDLFDVAQLVAIHGDPLIEDVTRRVVDIRTLCSRWDAFVAQLRR